MGFLQGEAAVLASQVGQPNGVAALDAGGFVSQMDRYGTRRHAAWINTNGANPFNTAAQQDIYTFDSAHWSGSNGGPFALTTQGGLLLARIHFPNISDYYTNQAYTIDGAVSIDNGAAVILAKAQIAAAGGWLEAWGFCYVAAVAAGAHSVKFLFANEGAAAGTWTYTSAFVELAEIGA